MQTNINGIISGIYKLENEQGQVYVGSAGIKNGIAKRWSNHLSRLRKGTYIYKELQDSWNQDPNNIKWEILELCNDDILEDREEYWFKHIARIDGWILINRHKKPVRKTPVKDTSKMIASQTGEKNGNRKYDVELIRSVKIQMAVGVDLNEISKETGISVGYLRLIKYGKKWASVSIETDEE